MQDKLSSPLRTLALGADASVSFFELLRNAESGVSSHVLRTGLSPIVQSFYFVNSGFSSDGRILWFYALIDGKRRLGLVDFEWRECRLVLGTEFLDASPLVEPESGDVLWIRGTSLYRRSARAGGEIQLLASLPEAMVQGEEPFRVATHLTLCSDRRAVTLDAQFPRRWLAGEIVLSDGSVNVWRRFDQCYNHSQFSPVDPDMQLIAQDGWTDPFSGEAFGYDRRIWLLRRNGECESLYDEKTPLHGHEWWDANGGHVWFVHYGQGIKLTDIHTRREELVWRGEFSHAHASADGNYVVADLDASGHAPRCRVRFLNRVTGKTAQIAECPWIGDPDAWQYHVHPHPRFVLGDRWIHYTTYEGGRISVALVSVDELIAATC